MASKAFNPARLWVVALLLAMPCSQVALSQPASGKKTLQRSVDPVIISAENLPDLMGIDIDSIHVIAFQKGRAVPVPFQIDQRDSQGDWVWDVVYRQPYIIDEEDRDVVSMRNPVSRGPGTVDDQDPRGQALLDANDVLVLMAEDLGDKSTNPPDYFDTAMVLEIEVTDSTLLTSGWVYVIWKRKSPPPRSSTRYMHYGRGGEKVVRSPLYHFHYSDVHAAMIHNLEVNGRIIIDRIRITGEITLNLPFLGTPISFDEEDVIGYTEGYIAGPIRIIKRNIAHLSLAGGLLKTPEVTCDHYYYPRHAEIPVCLSIRFPVKQIDMMLTTDYRDPPFSQLYMGGEAPAVTHLDNQSMVSRLQRLGTEWIALDSDAASIISLIVVPETLQGQAEASPCLCRAHREDGQAPGAPAVTGTHTEAGFLITSSTQSPKGEHVIYGTYLISASPYEPGDEDAVLTMRHRKLTTRVRLLTPPS